MPFYSGKKKYNNNDEYKSVKCRHLCSLFRKAVTSTFQDLFIINIDYYCYYFNIDHHSNTVTHTDSCKNPNRQKIQMLVWCLPMFITLKVEYVILMPICSLKILVCE